MLDDPYCIASELIGPSLDTRNGWDCVLLVDIKTLIHLHASLQFNANQWLRTSAYWTVLGGASGLLMCWGRLRNQTESVYNLLYRIAAHLHPVYRFTTAHIAFATILHKSVLMTTPRLALRWVL